MRPLILALLALTASSVHAQTTPVGTPEPGVTASVASDDGDPNDARNEAKDPRRAVLLSSLGSAGMFVPFVNLVAIPAGPALGHFYAGNERQAWTGIAIRGTALGVGLAAILGEAFRCIGGCGPQERDGGKAETVLLGSVVVILGSSLYDVATAGASAREYNRRHGLRTAAVPVVGPNGQVGVLVAVRL